jgi:maltokinase
VIPIELEVLVEGWPTVVWCPIEVIHSAGETMVHQLVLAIHQQPPPDADPAAFIGAVPVPSGTAYVYEALSDREGATLLAAHIAPDLHAVDARPLRGDHSNSSVMFGQRWLLKLYRRLESGPNPEVEITVALGRLGCDLVPVPLAVWRRHDWDLAIIRRLHPKATDGLELARRSLTELFDRRCTPGVCRRDFAEVARGLGETVAQVHLGLAEAFGAVAVDGTRLAERLVAHVRRIAPAGVDLQRIEATYRRLADADDLGAEIRVHGDLHLGQVLRTRRSWMLLDFEGEPDRPLAERRDRASPLRDVAGMLRSFHYAAELAVAERTVAPDPEALEQPPDPELALLADAWEERASAAFLDGYTSVPAVHQLLPTQRSSRDALLTLFELDKAVYEVAYELHHRPHLAGIPLRAVVRLLEPSEG